MEKVQKKTFGESLKTSRGAQSLFLLGLFFLVLLCFALSLVVGVSDLSLSDALSALLGKGPTRYIRIVRLIRLPRALAALIAGAGLAVAGLVMQTTLNNQMASPATLGVSGAAALGANVSLLVFAGGFLTLGRESERMMSFGDPFAVSGTAFLFAIASVLLILGLCRLKRFSSESIVLAGVAIGSVWTAATNVLQFYATDVGLSAAVVWTFGDLGRATFTQDFIMLGVVGGCAITFFLLSWRFNAMLGGDAVAKSVGVNASAIRLIGLLLASLITAVCVSFLGIIGFVGIICPHVVKKIVGSNHAVTIPASMLTGSLLLLLADVISRVVGSGSALPVGAITSLLGAPFFLALLFGAKERA